MSNTFRSLSNSESHLLAKYVHKYRELGLVIFFALNVFCRVDRLEQHPSIHSLPLVQFGAYPSYHREKGLDTAWTGRNNNMYSILICAVVQSAKMK